MILIFENPSILIISSIHIWRDQSFILFIIKIHIIGDDYFYCESQDLVLMIYIFI